MARTRVFGGNTVGQVGNWNHHLNWGAVDVRNSLYRWLASGSGTSEYYLDLVGGGNPGVPAEPSAVNANSVALVAGAMGSLAAGEWDYGDNDSLGYSTIYVRLSDSTDPDSKASGWVQYTAVPGTGEDVSIPVGAASITGYDNSAITLGDVRFEDGTTAQAGSSSAPLKLKCAGFYFGGLGTAYIDLVDSAIAPEIWDTAPANEGQRGLYLAGTAITTLRIMGGHVGFGWRAGELAKLNAFEVMPETGVRASLWIGPDVVDVAGTGHPDGTIKTGATVVSRCEVNAVVVQGGEYVQRESVWADMKAYAGTVKPEGSGTFAATLLAGAALTTEGSAFTKTLTACEVRKGSTLKDPASRITFTNAIEFPDGIVGLTLDFGVSRKFTPVAI